MNLLPGVIAKFAKMAATEPLKRYATNGIKMTFTEEGYRVEATDGRAAAIMEGPYVSEDFPPIPWPAPAEEEAPQSVLIPASALARIARLVESRNFSPVRAFVVFPRPQASNLIAADDLGVYCYRVNNLDGKFPDVAVVTPTTEPKFTVAVNAELLLQLLQIVVEIGDNNEGHHRVTIEFRGGGEGTHSPIVLRCQRGEATFTGLLMPLA